MKASSFFNKFLLICGVLISQAYAEPCSPSNLESLTIEIIQGEHPIPDRFFSVSVSGEACVQKRSVEKVKRKIKVKVSKKGKPKITLQAPFCKVIRIKPKPGKRNVRVKLQCENTPPQITEVSQVIEEGKIKLTFSVIDREGDQVTVLLNGEYPMIVPANSTQSVFFDAGMGGSALLLAVSDGSQSTSVALRIDKIENTEAGVVEATL